MKPSYFGEPSTFALVHCNYEKYSKVTKFPSTSAVAEQTSFRKNKHNPSYLFAVVWHESFTFLQIVLGSFYFWLIMKLKICLAAVWSMCFSASEGFQHRKRPENDPANLKAKYQSGLGRKTVPKFHCDQVLPHSVTSMVSFSQYSSNKNSQWYWSPARLACSHSCNPFQLKFMQMSWAAVVQKHFAKIRIHQINLWKFIRKCIIAPSYTLWSDSNMSWCSRFVLQTTAQLNP